MADERTWKVDQDEASEHSWTPVHRRRTSGVGRGSRVSRDQQTVDRDDGWVTRCRDTESEVGIEEIDKEEQEVKEVEMEAEKEEEEEEVEEKGEDQDKEKEEGVEEEEKKVQEKRILLLLKLITILLIVVTFSVVSFIFYSSSDDKELLMSFRPLKYCVDLNGRLASRCIADLPPDSAMFRGLVDAWKQDDQRLVQQLTDLITDKNKILQADLEAYLHHTLEAHFRSWIAGLRISMDPLPLSSFPIPKNVNDPHSPPCSPTSHPSHSPAEPEARHIPSSAFMRPTHSTFPQPPLR